jgi:hypothetical protein
MKKLLFLTNLICVLAFIVSCSNQNRSQSVEDLKGKEALNNDIPLIDTTKNGGQQDVSGSVGLDSGTVKDSTIDHGEPNPIIHGAPDQAKLDSIKKAKQKERD